MSSSALLPLFLHTGKCHSCICPSSQPHQATFDSLTIPKPSLWTQTPIYHLDTVQLLPIPFSPLTSRSPEFPAKGAMSPVHTATCQVPSHLTDLVGCAEPSLWYLLKPDRCNWS